MAFINVGHPQGAYIPVAEGIANAKQLFLSVFSLPSQIEINLIAYLETYNENFSSDWNQEKVFGRQDPIATFKDTSREITLAVKVIANSVAEGKKNLEDCNRLVQFLYPGYQAANRANTIARPPLCRLRFANLIRRADGADAPGAREGGLLGFFTSVSVTVDDDAGYFDPGAATLYPKVINLGLSYKPLHEHDLGWGPEIGFNNSEFVDFPFGKSDITVTESPDLAVGTVIPGATEEEIQSGTVVEVIPDENLDILYAMQDADAIQTGAEMLLDPARPNQGSGVGYGVAPLSGDAAPLDPSISSYDLGGFGPLR